LFSVTAQGQGQQQRMVASHSAQCSVLT